MNNRVFGKHQNPIPLEETFEGIWEKTEKWPDGPQILYRIVNRLKGKSLVAKFDEVNSAIQITFPIPIQSVTCLIPKRLQELFKTKLQEILDNCSPRVNRIVSPHMGYAMTSPLLAQINSDLQKLENNAYLEGAATLSDIANRAFGLPDRFASMYHRAKSRLE